VLQAVVADHHVDAWIACQQRPHGIGSPGRDLYR